MSTGAVAEPETDDGYEAVFNVKVFSDRELVIEVVGHDENAPRSGGSRKRYREEDKGACNSQHLGLRWCVGRYRLLGVSHAIAW